MDRRTFDALLAVVTMPLSAAKPRKRAPATSEKRKKTTVQSLVFDKKVFSRASAKVWAKSHGFKSSGVDETDKTYRIRQVSPSKFKANSFRMIKLTRGVKAVIGRLKG